MALYVFDKSIVEKYKGCKVAELLKELKKHDFDSFFFSFYVGILNYAILQEYLKRELTEEERSSALFSGFLHDIGKLGMSRDFLRFEGKYSLSMFEEMTNHAKFGGLLLKESEDATKNVWEAASYHHCNFDGSGYPGNLFGEEIPFYARLTRISDSVDAFLSKRCYKDGGPAYEAYSDLKNYEGSSYDREILNAFKVVHDNVMDECHRIGEDRPSKNLYMDFLIKLYQDIPNLNSSKDVFGYLEGIKKEG